MIKYQTYGDNVIAIVHNRINREKFLVTYSKNSEGGYQIAVFRELGWFKYFFKQHEFKPLYLLEVNTDEEAREGVKKVAELFETSDPNDVIRGYTKITHSSGASILLDETGLKEMERSMNFEKGKLHSKVNAPDSASLDTSATNGTKLNIEHEYEITCKNNPEKMESIKQNSDFVRKVSEIIGECIFKRLTMRYIDKYSEQSLAEQLAKAVHIEIFQFEREEKYKSLHDRGFVNDVLDDLKNCEDIKEAYTHIIRSLIFNIFALPESDKKEEGFEMIEEWTEKLKKILNSDKFGIYLGGKIAFLGYDELKEFSKCYFVETEKVMLKWSQNR